MIERNNNTNDVKRCAANALIKINHNQNVQNFNNEMTLRRRNFK